MRCNCWLGRGFETVRSRGLSSSLLSEASRVDARVEVNIRFSRGATVFFDTREISLEVGVEVPLPT